MGDLAVDVEEEALALRLGCRAGLSLMSPLKHWGGLIGGAGPELSSLPTVPVGLQTPCRLREAIQGSPRDRLHHPATGVAARHFQHCRASNEGAEVGPGMQRSGHQAQANQSCPLLSLLPR